MRVLVVLDAVSPELEPIRSALTVRGHVVSTATPTQARTLPTADAFTSVDVIIVDAEVAEASQLIAKLAAVSPGIEFVLIGTKHGVLPADVLEQFERPVDVERLLAVIDEVADILDGERLREPIDLVAYETVFAGDSPEIRAMLRRVRLVARSEAPVWIVGDDGSGRGIAARAIHDRSSRRKHPFVAFNTAAYVDEELARLLFEGEQAAAVAAGSGTLFLDQVGSAGPITQRQMLQFLQAKRPDDPRRARLIVGAQREDATTAAGKRFSTELFYLLKVLELEIPALKERARDLEQIVARMLARLASEGSPPVVSVETMRLLERHTFPGNLLELAHALTHAVVLAHGRAIEPQHLPASIRHNARLPEVVGAEDDLQSLDTVAKRFERDYLLRVLRSVDGNRGRAAEILGLSRKGLWGKLKAHGLSDDDIDQADVSDSAKA